MKIAILGSGAFGTALAHMLATQKTHQVTLWSNEPDVLDHINQYHRHPSRLKDLLLHPSIKGVHNLDQTLTDNELVILAVPMAALEQVLLPLKPLLTHHHKLLSVIKGVMPGPQFVSHLLEKHLGTDILTQTAFFSGPTFAYEMALGDLSCAALASQNPSLSQHLFEQLKNPMLAIQTTPDIMGVQMGGALKNVLAIGAGIIEGLDLGHNPKAFYLTAALQELACAIQAYGGQYETAFGPAALGDLYLTCTGGLSRNRFVGQELAKGNPLETILKNMPEYAEGVHTAKLIPDLIEKVQINLPIMQGIHDILFEQSPAKETLFDVLKHVQWG